MLSSKEDPHRGWEYADLQIKDGQMYRLDHLTSGHAPRPVVVAGVVVVVVAVVVLVLVPVLVAAALAAVAIAAAVVAVFTGVTVVAVVDQRHLHLHIRAITPSLGLLLLLPLFVPYRQAGDAPAQCVTLPAEAMDGVMPCHGENVLNSPQ